MGLKSLLIVAALIIAPLAVQPVAAQEAKGPVIRIAELEIDPAQMAAYSAAVKEEMEESIRVEPGVLALYAVSIKGQPNHLQILRDVCRPGRLRGPPGIAAFQEIRRDHQEHDHVAQALRDGQLPAQRQAVMSR